MPRSDRPDPAAAMAGSAEALLVVSFGGPEAPEEVMPFLRRVTAGRGVPDDRLAEVAEHYRHFGGRSPINALNRRLVEDLRVAAAAAGRPDLPVVLANRNSAPFLPDVLGELGAAGHRDIAVVQTSAYSSYSSCRQYRENLADAVRARADDPAVQAMRFRLLPRLYDRAGFLDPFADGLRAAMAALPPGSEAVFVTHAIPTAMNDRSGTVPGRYVTQHLAAAARVLEAATGTDATPTLVYCSRSGPASVPWLEPDVNDHLRGLAARDVPGVAVVPLGFVSDHMEVVYDLDTEAAATAAEVGLAFRRVPTPGPDPRFAADIVRLLGEVEQGDAPAACPAGCCLGRDPSRPALCGLDGPRPSNRPAGNNHRASGA